ncbi:hypothetical protein PT276_08350 [Orbaceae bacterium ESL0721]|nr:hypothetical protein [Orbaceae bacterium ESL0721]
MRKLHKNMSIEEFECGYFYATELKMFAKELNINIGSLRKNEIEEHIKAYLLGCNKIELPKNIENRQTKGERDKLLPDAYVVNYVSDKKTKMFLKTEITKIDSTIKDKSGQWYWLNDWRKQQIRDNQKITYKHLIDHLYNLMKTEGKLPRIPSTRFNNFITDYLADSDHTGATRQAAIDAWERLKTLPAEKNYQAYKALLKDQLI